MANITEYAGRDMQGNPIIELPDPTNPQDAATKAYVDANFIYDVDNAPSTERWLHLRARTADLTDVGGDIREWRDISGNARHFSRNVASSVTFATGVTAGLSTADEVVTNTGTFLRREDGSGVAIEDALPSRFLVFVFGRPTSAGTNNFWSTLKFNGASGADRWLLGGGGATANGIRAVHVQQSDDGTNAGRWFGTGNSLRDTQRHLIAASGGVFQPKMYLDSYPLSSAQASNVGNGLANANALTAVTGVIGGTINTGATTVNIATAVTEILVLDVTAIEDSLNASGNTTPVGFQDRFVQKVFNFYRYVRGYDF